MIFLYDKKLPETEVEIKYPENEFLPNLKMSKYFIENHFNKPIQKEKESNSSSNSSVIMNISLDPSEDEDVLLDKEDIEEFSKLQEEIPLDHTPLQKNAEKTQESMLQEMGELKNPLFNPKAALEFAKQAASQLPASIISYALPRTHKINRLNAVLNKLPPIDPSDASFEKKVKLVSELISLALYPPVLKNGQILSMLSFEKTLKCLEDSELLQKIDSRYFEEPNSAAQKMYLISRLNLSKSYANQEENELQKKIYNSPSLALFLSHKSEHPTQGYRQTCVSTAHNLYFQRRLGSIAEMLIIAKETLRTARDNFFQLPKEKQLESAHETLYGTAKTRKEYIETTFQSIESKILKLEKQALQTIEKKAPSLEEINELTTSWNFVMQDIATVLEPMHPRIFHQQIVPTYYRISAVFGAIRTGIQQLFPGQAKLTEYWHGIRPSVLQKEIGNRFFMLGEVQGIYRMTAQAPQAGPLLEQVETNALWEKIHQTNGSILDFFYFSKGSGHTIFVEAGLREMNGSMEKIFIVHDSMSNKEMVYDLSEFRKYISENYEKEDKTNSMYMYPDS